MNEIIDYLQTGINQLGGDLILPIASAIVIIMIIWSGFKYITGDAEAGKKSLTAAIIGLAIIILAFVIINELIDVINSVK